LNFRLFDRVLSFNALPQYRDNVYDPDPQKSYTKAKLKRDENRENMSPNVPDHTVVSFPSEEIANGLFNENFSVLPNFVPMDAFQHLKNTGKSSTKYKNIDVVINSNDKGLRMMRFIHDLQVYKMPDQSQIFVRACCWASYKRDRKYKVKFQQSVTEKVKSACCDRQCPASKSECCCHVMAVIWKLEDMTRKGELKDCSEGLSCTSKPRQWGKGGKREIGFHPVMATSIEKPRHASDVSNKRKRGIHSQRFYPRPLKSRKLDSNAVVKWRNDLQVINPQIPFASMLPDKNSIPTVNYLIGNERLSVA